MVVLRCGELRDVFPVSCVAPFALIEPFMPHSSFQVSQNSALPAVSPQPAPNASLIGFLVIAFTLSLVLTSFGYKKYRAHQRSRLLKRQVALLETMWRISSAKRER